MGLPPTTPPTPTPSGFFRAPLHRARLTAYMCVCVFLCGSPDRWLPAGGRRLVAPTVLRRPSISIPCNIRCMSFTASAAVLSPMVRLVANPPPPPPPPPPPNMPVPYPTPYMSRP